jgi:hypothetical protein
LDAEPLVTPRNRRPPAWVKDYVTSIENVEDEDLHNLAVFSNNHDPSTYEAAAKFDIWRKRVQNIVHKEKIRHVNFKSTL